MNHIVLYGCHSSSATRRVRIALKVKQIAYKYIEVNLSENEHLCPEFRQLTAQQKLPVLLHDQHQITQSLSIIEYLDDICPEYKLLPEDPIAKAWCRSFSAIFVADYHPLITRRVIKKLRDSGLPEKEIAQWKPLWLKESLNIAEIELNKRSIKHKFCCSNLVGLADICLYAQCESAINQDIYLTDYKEVSKIHQNVMAVVNN
ncbi:glutathione S-transferase N-terminal domain-containing protein [Vibrio quintilis]|uniref:Maleylpyruvate isomerase n=1 Tax=Vibrio quintilis TaxID=1117707 RepID=A0A1M7YZ13_9VIBR|nr:glutathione S-transferase N-terminal domain-containing protein [Vibrio quintilis]SHO57929.1 Maleylpyruvate isomerase [Vibrio quintilis]